ncbi:MAG: DUF3368 domain-containing protein [Anaerolineales bacterium]|nr:DUF3368 domain-containing protein [Chloroflexota bacterium]MBL7163082.1 DUF3368 domain-containing protein [Anaerolineales bacterium]
MTSVISNTSPLIGLSVLGKFDLLRELFSEVLIPESVFQEVTVKGTEGIGSQEVAKAIAEGWIKTTIPFESETLTTLKVDLDIGEADAIALALENDADLLLLDERKARAKAQALGCNILGTIGVLLLAQTRGIEIDIRSALNQLREFGFHISDSIYQRILASIE